MLRPEMVPKLNVGGVTLFQSLAALLPLIVVLLDQGMAKALLLAVAVLIVLFWEVLFAVLRKKPFGFYGIATAMIVAILAPSTLDWWQLALPLSLGCVLGDHIFGGRGFGFLNPSAICLSLLLLSFPQVQLEPMSSAVALATLPGALLLLLTGLISWRVIIASSVMIFALILLANGAAGLLLTGVAMLFGLIFLTSDPTAAAATNPGRWVYGLLAGLLITLFSTGSGAITTSGLVFGSLTASIFAPLIDHLVVLAKARYQAHRVTRRGRQSVA
jgi:Na+-transporting NADH:ubiquinone oxidoreductase subunit B